MASFPVRIFLLNYPQWSPANSPWLLVLFWSQVKGCLLFNSQANIWLQKQPQTVGPTPQSPMLDSLSSWQFPGFIPSHVTSGGLSTLKSVFSELGVPLSEEKTKGPSTLLEFLGITLETMQFQASLPIEKSYYSHPLKFLPRSHILNDSYTPC